MALVITEDWIRERVQLNHDNLEDVKSLALPGTYHEKITELSNSMRNFTRLKNLDLSRNSLVSLKGLSHLKMLEKLNLYYNSIETLKDLFRLRHNPSLKDIDLRLNPVTKNEPDYRLFVIHMLPNLKKLDDRSVRDMERKAALTHFSSEQAVQFTDTSSAPGENTTQHTHDTEQIQNPRVESIRRMATNPSVLENDDCRMMDDIARVNGDLDQPRPITGSTTKSPSAVEYSRDSVYELERADAIRAGELTYQNNLSQQQQQRGQMGNYLDSHQFTVSSMPINGQELSQGVRPPPYTSVGNLYPVPPTTTTTTTTTSSVGPPPTTITENNVSALPHYNTSPNSLSSHRNNFGPYNNIKAAEIQQRPPNNDLQEMNPVINSNTVDFSISNTQPVYYTPTVSTEQQQQRISPMQQQQQHEHQLMHKMAASHQQKPTNNGVSRLKNGSKSSKKKGDKMKVRFFEERHDAVLNDNIASHLITKDESSAYNAYQSIATFTPNPTHAGTDDQATVRSNITESENTHITSSSSSNNSTPRDDNSSPSSTTSSSSDDFLDFPKPSFELNSRNGDEDNTPKPRYNSNIGILPPSSRAVTNTAVKYSNGPAPYSTHTEGPAPYSTHSEGPVVLNGEVSAPILPFKDKQFLDKLCDLVDKYWNGSKSLHSHSKFQGLAHKVVTEYGSSSVPNDSPSPSGSGGGGGGVIENELTQLRRDISAFADENISLRQQLRTQDVGGGGEVERLRGEVQTVNSDNIRLREQMNKLRADTTQTQSQSQDADMLRKDNTRLKSELDTLKTQLKQYLRVEEMARLLQESHSSLVATNEQLLRELNDTRSRHQKEVEQLHWNFEQLKQTMSYTPSSYVRDYSKSLHDELPEPMRSHPSDVLSWDHGSRDYQTKSKPTKSHNPVYEKYLYSGEA